MQLRKKRLAVRDVIAAVVEGVAANRNRLHVIAVDERLIARERVHALEEDGCGTCKVNKKGSNRTSGSTLENLGSLVV